MVHFPLERVDQVSELVRAPPTSTARSRRARVRVMSSYMQKQHGDATVRRGPLCAVPLRLNYWYEAVQDLSPAAPLGPLGRQRGAEGEGEERESEIRKGERERRCTAARRNRSGTTSFISFNSAGSTSRVSPPYCRARPFHGNEASLKRGRGR